MNLRSLTKRSKTVITGLCATYATAVMAVSPESAYPSKPVQLVVGFSAGSATDIATRLFAERLKVKLGAPIVIVNKPGAGGMIAADYVAKADPDGYTLLVSNPSLATGSFLYEKVPFNVTKDLAGVGLIGETPNVVIVTPELGVKTIAELVALAKANPKSVNYASGGLGTLMHLNCELLAIKAGIELQVVPYASASSSIATDFMSNRVQMMCVPLPSALPFLRADQAVALGVMSSSPISDPIETSSIRQQSGLDVVIASWTGIFAPVNVPPAIMKKLGEAMEETQSDPQTIQKLRENGLSVRPIVLRDFDAYFQREMGIYGPLIKSMGIKLN